ncbi:MAG TPA: phosphatase PAP2 family protein [Xanthomonadaceae bacterium]|jgi:undecaprenyl-diphosphatase
MNVRSHQHGLVERETRLCVAANRWGRRSAVRSYFAAASRLGDGVFWYALMALIVLVRAIEGQWLDGLRASAHMAATGVVALLLYRWLKRYTRRPRPYADDARIAALVPVLDEFSFPSGHTLHAVSFTLVALGHYPMLAWLLIPFSASVAVSRVVLGVHYPSDVLAATAIGTAIASVSLWLVPGATLFG